MRHGTRMAWGAAMAAMLVALAPQGAQAQFGGLIRKAAEKAVDKATGAEDKVASRPSGAELTDDAVNRLLKGLGTAAEKLDQRDALQARVLERRNAAEALRGPNSAVIDGYQQGLSNWESCMGTALSKVQKGNEAKQQMAVMRAATDPKLSQEMAQRVQEMNDAQQKAMASGDTLALQAAQAKYATFMMKIAGIDLAADSAKARGTCGQRPAKPAFLAQLERIEAQRDSLSEAARDIESVAAAAGAKAAGMDLGEYSLQKEKVTAFIGSGNGSGLLTRDELNRLRAKRAELEKVKKAL